MAKKGKTKTQLKVFYLCDGEDPRCKDSLDCWKNDSNDGMTHCRHTNDITHALHFHKSKQMDYWKERGSEDDSALFED